MPNNFAIPGGLGLTNINISAGTTSNNLSNLIFSNSNGVTFGLNGSTITASAAGGAGGNVNFSAGTTSSGLDSVVFSNSNGISFGLNGSTITGSVATSLSNIRVSAGTTSNLLSAFTFSNLNGVSFGLDASTITASVATSLSNFRLSAGTTSNLLSAVTFSNSNGISFGLNASTVTASHNAITSQSNQVLTLYATGNTTQSSTGTQNASSLIFDGLGVASVGISGGSVRISVPAGGGGLTNIRVSAGTTSNLLSDVTFADSNGVSFGINASTITASVAGAGFTHKIFQPYFAEQLVASQIGQGSLHIHPVPVECNFQHDRMGLRVNYSNASNSTGSITVSMWAGFYTSNASTLSLAYSGSTSKGLTFSGTVGDGSLQLGPRVMTLGWTNTVPEGDYWLAIVSRTTSGGANASISQFCASQVNSSHSGVLGQASNASVQRILGFGVWSATTSGMPGSIAFSDIRGANSSAHRPPSYFFISGTV